MIRLVEARGALDIARRLKQNVSQVYRFAIASGWAKLDPTLGLSDALKPKPPVKHMARVPLKEFPKLVQAIFAYHGEDTPRRSSWRILDRAQDTAAVDEIGRAHV